MDTDITPAALFARVAQADGLMTKLTNDGRTITTLRFPRQGDHIEMISCMLTNEQAAIAIKMFDPDGSIRERSMKNVDLALYK